MLGLERSSYAVKCYSGVALVFRAKTARIARSNYARNGTKPAQNKQRLFVCMTPPDKSFSSEIDLFHAPQELAKLPDRSFPPAACFVPRQRPQRCHAMQL